MGLQKKTKDANLVDIFSLLGFGAALTLIDNEEKIAQLVATVIPTALMVEFGAIVLQLNGKREIIISSQREKDSPGNDLAIEIKEFITKNASNSVLRAENAGEFGVNETHLPQASAAGLKRLIVNKLRTVESSFGFIIAGKLSGDVFLPEEKAFLQAIASQAAMAVHRIQLSHERNIKAIALRESEERLSRIFESAMDAIITIDENRRVIIFNEAAGIIFNYSPEDAVNKPIDRFLSEEFQDLLKVCIQDFRKAQNLKSYMWAPEGLTAFRANGEEFPIEATISHVKVSGQDFFTIILRDINDRKTAEEELQKLQLQNVYLQAEIKSEYNLGEIIGVSKVMRAVFKNIKMVAATDSTVLLTGETGTGKELIARAIHSSSKRADKVLVTVNCGALPSGLVESELFGHEKGAFTGATAQKKGRFELADGGTIFLDEVGELPLDTQTRLLRILQEQEYERVGGTKSKKVDVRIIAATNVDLAEAIQQGAFRADLFYRLNIFPIHLPPLKARLDDIPLLANALIKKFSRRLGKNVVKVSAKALEKLTHYNWPGNVRELANILERAVILCGHQTILPEHIGIAVQTPPLAEKTWKLEEVERNHILKVLTETGWRIEGKYGAALLLGMNPGTLRSRMKKLGITRPRPEI